jgi:hypothetical protein
MVNAEYPAPESADTVRRLRSEVQRLGLEANVQLHTDFFDDDACFELLSEGDLIVNPYQTTGESASGAVRYGLAIGRPVAVTPLSIFDDLGDAVFRMPGTSPADLARGIAQTLDQLSAKSETARRVEASANRWRDEHDFNRQGARLMQIAKTLAS